MLAEPEPASPAAQGVSDEVFAALVEECLRRLHDFSFLGDHQLGQLRGVGGRLSGPPVAVVTHIDRGKALQAVLLEALDKLRPAGPAWAAAAVARVASVHRLARCICAPGNDSRHHGPVEHK
jgi:hypothetical protein